jgi:hypothetical protein
MRSTIANKLSIVGIVLIGVSAVAAAIIPTNDKSAVLKGHPGTLTPSQNNGKTCTTMDPGENEECIDTETGPGPNDSKTTPFLLTTSTDAGGGGDPNTTLGS